MRKLTYSTAQKIRAMKQRDPSLTPRKILSQLNLPCSIAVIYFILKGKTYKTLKHSQHNPKQVLTAQNVKEIRGYLHLGYRLEWIALKYGVSYITIYRIKKRMTWSEVK